VLSLLMVLLGTLSPLGRVLQGAIADRVGLRATTAGAGVLMAAALLLVRMLRPDLGRALDEPESGPAERGDGDGDEPERAGHLAVPPGPEAVVAADGTRDRHRDEPRRRAERSH
jgi:hypothetical protein